MTGDFHLPLDITIFFLYNHNEKVREILVFRTDI